MNEKEEKEEKEWGTHMGTHMVELLNSWIEWRDYGYRGAAIRFANSVSLVSDEDLSLVTDEDLEFFKEVIKKGIEVGRRLASEASKP